MKKHLIPALVLLSALLSGDRVNAQDPYARNWVKIGHDVVHFVADHAGGEKLFAVTSNGRVYQYNQKQNPKKPDGWTAIGGGSDQLTTAGGTVYSIQKADGSIYKHTPTGKTKWTLVGKNGKKLIVHQASLYAITRGKEGLVYKYHSGIYWEKIGANAVQIDGYEDHLRMLTADGKVMDYLLGPKQKKGSPASQNWATIGTGATFINVNGSEVYAITSDGKTRFYTGKKGVHLKKDATQAEINVNWPIIGEDLVQVDAHGFGASLHGVSKAGVVMRYDGNHKDNHKWTPVGSDAVSVHSIIGNVYIVKKDKTLWKYVPPKKNS